jgi:hypothetical protein
MKRNRSISENSFISQINHERGEISSSLVMTGQPGLKEMLYRWRDEGTLKVNKGIDFNFALSI